MAPSPVDTGAGCGSRPVIPPQPVATEMAGDAGRVRKELAECARDTDSGVTATPKGDSLSHLEGTILGPEGTPFEGGTFVINIDIPSGYPFEPPKMKFVTKIWHPNISSQTGAICLVSSRTQELKHCIVGGSYRRRFAALAVVLVLGRVMIRSPVTLLSVCLVPGKGIDHCFDLPLSFVWRWLSLVSLFALLRCGQSSAGVLRVLRSVEHVILMQFISVCITGAP